MKKYIRWKRMKKGIRITAQSHRGRRFGASIGDSLSAYGEWKSALGFRMASIDFPERLTMASQVYVRGSDKSRDDNLIAGPAAYLDRVEAAFRAYNKAHRK